MMTCVTMNNYIYKNFALTHQQCNQKKSNQPLMDIWEQIGGDEYIDLVPPKDPPINDFYKINGLKNELPMPNEENKIRCKYILFTYYLQYLNFNNTDENLKRLEDFSRLKTSLDTIISHYENNYIDNLSIYKDVLNRLKFNPSTSSTTMSS